MPTKRGLEGACRAEFLYAAITSTAENAPVFFARCGKATCRITLSVPSMYVQTSVFPIALVIRAWQSLKKFSTDVVQSGPRSEEVKNRKKAQRAPVILAIDQGTTGTKAVLVDSRLRILAEHSQEFAQHFPRPGWVEHELEEIYASVRKSVRAVLRKAKVSSSRLAAVGITNQRETTAIWDKSSGRPLHRAIVWQDRRTAQECDRLRKDGVEPLVKRRTGLLLDPYFSGTKLSWLKKNVPAVRTGLRQGRLLFGTIDSYLIWRLTGGQSHVTDVSNASRTLLMDLKKSRWSPELCDLFGVPTSILPEIVDNDAIFGHTVATGFLPAGLPIASAIGDQQAALFGQACFRVGEAKCTYGTGAFLMINTGDRVVRSRHGVLSTAAWRLKKRTVYALEGSSFVAGAIVQWLRDGLQLIKTAPEVETLAAQVDTSDGVVLVPALTGLGAPHWDPMARGLLSGVTRGTTRNHIARAALDGIALQIHDLVRAMEADLGRGLRYLKVDGGASLNNLLMQYQSDILRMRVVRPHTISTTALGAALQAGLTIGIFSSLADIRKVWREDRSYRPTMKRREVSTHVARWEKAVQRARL